MWRVQRLKCARCKKTSKEHTKNLWRIHQEVKPCLLCGKTSVNHSEKLWEMHQTVLAFGSKGEKLRPITIGSGPTSIARVHKIPNARPPYDVELIPIHMHCTDCKSAMSASEVNIADVLNGLCLKCFCEETDQDYTWHSKPWWEVNGGKYSGGSLTH